MRRVSLFFFGIGEKGIAYSRAQVHGQEYFLGSVVAELAADIGNADTPVKFHHLSKNHLNLRIQALPAPMKVSQLSSLKHLNSTGSFTPMIIFLINQMNFCYLVKNRSVFPKKLQIIAFNVISYTYLCIEEVSDQCVSIKEELFALKSNDDQLYENIYKYLIVSF